MIGLARTNNQRDGTCLPWLLFLGMALLLACGCSTSERKQPARNSTSSSGTADPAATERKRTHQTAQRSQRLLLVGDIHFGENYFADPAWQGQNLLEQRGYHFFLSKVEKLLSLSDCAIGNLEAVATNDLVSPWQGQKQYIHWTNPRMAPATLARHGLHAVSLANNHATDFGSEGIRATQRQLARHKVASFGAGDKTEALQPYRLQLQVANHSLSIAIVPGYWYRPSQQEFYQAYATENRAGVHMLTSAIIKAQIGQLRRNNPELFILVFPHWGSNYKWRNQQQSELAHAAIDAGADLVVGHGAHHFQEIERYRGKWILYNLGNFVFLTPGRYQQLGTHSYSMTAELVFRPTHRQQEISLQLRFLESDNLRTEFQAYVLTADAFAVAVNLLLSKSPQSDLWRDLLLQQEDAAGSYLMMTIGGQ